MGSLISEGGQRELGELQRPPRWGRAAGALGLGLTYSPILMSCA